MTENEESGTAKGTIARRVVAVILAVAATGFFVASRYVDDLKACRTTVVGRATTTTCEPVPIADMAPIVLLLIVLVWVDLREIELTGVGRVVRRVEEKQGELQDGQARLEHQLQMVQVTALSQKNEVNIFPELVSRVAGETPRQQPPEEREGKRQVGNEADPRAELLSLWDQLAIWSRLASRLADPYVIEALRRAEAGGRPLAQADGLLVEDQEILERTVGSATVGVDRLLRWQAEASARLEIVRIAVRRAETESSSTLADAAVVARALLASTEELLQDSG